MYVYMYVCMYVSMYVSYIVYIKSCIDKEAYLRNIVVEEIFTK